MMVLRPFRREAKRVARIEPQHKPKGQPWQRTQLPEVGTHVPSQALSPLFPGSRPLPVQSGLQLMHLLF